MMLKDFRFPSTVFFQPNFLIDSVEIQSMPWADFFPPFFLLKQPISLEYFKAVLTISCWVGLFWAMPFASTMRPFQVGVFYHPFSPLAEPPSNLRLLITSPK